MAMRISSFKNRFGFRSAQRTVQEVQQTPLAETVSRLTISRPNRQPKTDCHFVTLSVNSYYYPPANAVAVQVISGDAWVAIRKSNIFLYPDDRLNLTVIPYPVSITSKGKRHVMLEVTFAS